MYRVAEIRENFCKDDLYYKPGKLNVADDCSRPLPLNTICEKNRCLNRQQFLLDWNIDEFTNNNRDTELWIRTNFGDCNIFITPSYYR